MALAIATILTTYLSALTLSNQAFAMFNFGPNPGEILAGHKGQAGDLLAQKPQPEHIPLTPLTPPEHFPLKPVTPLSDFCDFCNHSKLCCI